MNQQQSFEIIYDSEVVQHLAKIERKYHSLIRQTIENQLSYEPLTQTSNRKPLTHSTEFGEHTWEIRFGPNNRFRVFYRVKVGEWQVRVLAIGIKIRDRLLIGSKEFRL